jgi:hypothetical protein
VIGMKRSFVAMAATAMLLVPDLATACSVCFTGRADETRVAFIVTTGLMTALPLLLIGSVIWWLRRRAQQIHDEQE